MKSWMSFNREIRAYKTGENTGVAIWIDGDAVFAVLVDHGGVRPVFEVYHDGNLVMWIDEEEKIHTEDFPKTEKFFVLHNRGLLKGILEQEHVDESIEWPVYVSPKQKLDNPIDIKVHDLESVSAKWRNGTVLYEAHGYLPEQYSKKGFVFYIYQGLECLATLREEGENTFSGLPLSERPVAFKAFSDALTALDEWKFDFNHREDD